MQPTPMHLVLLAVLASVAATAQDKPAKPKNGSEAKSDETAHAIDAPDVADIPTQDLLLGKDENRRYLLDGPRKDEKEPKDGFGLLVVLAGGDGSADFHPFVKRVYKNSVPDGFLVVQPIAPRWTKDPPIVWPTEKARASGMKFTTEEFVEAVIEDVGKLKKVDATKVRLLAWSSSGPAAYVIAATKKGLVKGSLIAMSVFHPRDFDLGLAKDRKYYILHSPQDELCPFRMAEDARDTLLKQGAQVELTTYEGGHGWRGNPFVNIRTGLEWLSKPGEKR